MRNTIATVCKVKQGRDYPLIMLLVLGSVAMPVALIGAIIDIYRIAIGQYTQAQLGFGSPTFWIIILVAFIVMLSIAGIAIWFGFKEYLKSPRYLTI